MIRRLLIANRGEIAVRLIDVCHELSTLPILGLESGRHAVERMPYGPQRGGAVLGHARPEVPARDPVCRLVFANVAGVKPRRDDVRTRSRRS